MAVNLDATALVHKPTEIALTENKKIKIKHAKRGINPILVTLILFAILFVVSAAIVYFIYGRYNQPPEIISPLS